MLSISEEEVYLDLAKEVAKNAISFAQSGGSGKKVGCGLISRNMIGETKIFSGCNIELSQSRTFHAEQVALFKSISEGFYDPLICVVTSTSPEQRACMCGYCMQDYSYTNKWDLKIIVIDPLTLEEQVRCTLRERQGEFGYFTGRGLLNEDN